MAKSALMPPVDLVPSGKVERHPETRLGAVLPVTATARFEASAAAKLRLAARKYAGPSPPAIFEP